jgi:hypothetical protein
MDRPGSVTHRGLLLPAFALLDKCRKTRGMEAIRVFMSRLHLNISSVK